MMARYIDADVAISALKRWLKFPDYNKGEKNIIACAINMLEEAPSADVAERKKGKWIFNPSDAIEMMFTKPKCSECGFESADGGNYCPNCGADMRGERDERIN